MNATNFGTNKDFRKTIDIRRKMRHGKIEKKIYLPPDDFAYGLPNRPPTPFKDVIYNAFGNRAEDVIRNEYDCYIKERSVKNKRPPKVIPRYINPKVEELKKREMEKKAGSLNYNPLEEFKSNNYDTSNMNRGVKVNNNFNQNLVMENNNSNININNNNLKMEENQKGQGQNSGYINNSFRPTPSGERIRQAAASNFF